MVYIARWERLSDAVTRVMGATGLSREEAQTDLCRAIGDGAVKIRAKLDKHTSRPSHSRELLQGEDFQIPTRIEPVQSKRGASGAVGASHQETGS